MAIRRRGSFSFPRKWSPIQVPNFPVEVDTTHPLAQGLVGFYLPGLNLEVLNRSSGTIVGSAKFAPGPIGPALLTSTANDYATFPLPAQLLGAANISLMFGGMITSSSAAFSNPISFPYYPSTWASPYGTATFTAYSNANILNFQVISAAISYTTTSVASTIIGAHATFGATQGPSVAGINYLNGAATATNSQSNPYTGVLDFGTGGTIAIMGAGVAAVGQSIIGYGSFATVHNVILSPGYMSWLDAEPFIMLRPIVRRQYYGRQLK